MIESKKEKSREERRRADKENKSFSSLWVVYEFSGSSEVIDTIQAQSKAICPLDVPLNLPMSNRNHKTLP